MDREELVGELRDSGAEALAALLSVPESALRNGGYENGWTVRQIMAHVASMEFTYLRLPEIARGSGDAQTTAAGGRFDMDGYNARQVEKRAAATPAELAEEFTRGRARLITLVATLDEGLLSKPIRTAGGVTGTLVEALAATAVRHVRGHSADFVRAAGAEPGTGDRMAAALLIAAAEAAVLLEGITDEQWKHHASDGDWSAAGIAGHLIELMPYWASKLAQAAADPGTALGRDLNSPERLGGVVDGEAMSPAQATEVIGRAAGEAAMAFQGIPAAAWQISADSPRYGRLPLEQMAERLLVQHVREHVQQIAQALAPASAASLPA